jgi:hypothetical protein
VATTITFESHTPPGNGPGGSKASGTLSVNDITVNTTTNNTGGWATASVTADKVRTLYLNTADAATAAMPPGTYENAGGAIFRKV